MSISLGENPLQGFKQGDGMISFTFLKISVAAHQNRILESRKEALMRNCGGPDPVVTWAEDSRL